MSCLTRRTGLAAVLIAAAATGCTDSPSGPDSSAPPVTPGFSITPAGDVTADRDTYLRQGSPNQNQGADTVLRIQASGNNRIAVGFSQAELVSAAGGKSLVSAKLVLKVHDNADNWGTTGRLVDIHRLTSDWTDAGATWNCAVDANTANGSPNCSGATQWDMSGSGPRPWVTTPTNSVLITNGLSGNVTIDVTADVAAFLAGSAPNYGWIIKKQNEGAAGKIEFKSHEASAPPRLVLELVNHETRYPLDGNLDDLGPGAFHGTGFGSPQFAADRFGVAGMALRFDGLDDSLRLPSPPTNSLTAGTVTFWLSLDDNEAQYNLFAKRVGAIGSSSPYPLRAQLADGPPADSWYFQVEDEVGSGASPDYLPAAAYDFTGWHKYTFTWSPTGKSVYLDDRLITAYTGRSFSPLPAFGEIIFGPQSLSHNEMLRGVVDEIRTYPRELSYAEVQSAFAAEQPTGLPDFVPTGVVGPDAVVPGETVSVTTTEANLGPGMAPLGWLGEIRLSLDQTCTSSTIDPDAAVFTQTIGIGPGGSTTSARSATVPASIPAGTYYWCVILDPAGGTVSEANEGNNTYIGNQVTISPIIPSGLVAYYRLDGDGTDATANANHGTVTGATAAVGHGGLAGTALEFDAGGDEVRVPSNPVIRGLLSELTVVVWVKRGATDITGGMIPIARRSGVPIHFELYAGDGGFGFQCCSTPAQVTGSYFVASGTGLTGINDGQWHKVAATRRFGPGGATQLYLDGLIVSANYTAGSADDSAEDMVADFLIGHQESASPGQFIGLLDDVMIFNRVLTQSEIQSIQ